MTDYTREVIEALEENGYEFLRRGKGDHSIWWNPTTRTHITIDGKIRSRNFANRILKQAKLPKQF